MIGQAFASSQKPIPNTRGISAVIFGDSITGQNSGGTAGSRQATLSARGYFNWVQFKLKNPFYCPMGYDGNLTYNTGSTSGTGRAVGHNAGIGSDRLPGMINRLQSDVIALKPAFCFFHGGTNDLKNNDTAANIKTNIATIIDRIVAANIHPVVIGILPRNNADGGGGYDFDAAQRLRRADINRATRAKCRAVGATYVNPDPHFCDPATGDARTGYTGEGLHPNAVGAEALADAVIAALPPGLLPSYPDITMNPYDLYDATNNPFGNLLPNPMLSGTSGSNGVNCSGQVATSWTAEMTSVSATSSVVGSKSTMIVNGVSVVSQKFVITHPGNGLSNEIFRFKINPVTITTGAPSGTWLEEGAYIKVSAPTGTKNLIGACMVLDDVSDGQFVRSGIYRDTGVYMNGVAREGFIGMIPRRMSGSSGVRPSLQFSFDNTIAGETTVEIALPFMGVCPVDPPITYV